MMGVLFSFGMNKIYRGPTFCCSYPTQLADNNKWDAYPTQLANNNKGLIGKYGDEDYTKIYK